MMTSRCAAVVLGLALTAADCGRPSDPPPAERTAAAPQPAPAPASTEPVQPAPSPAPGASAPPAPRATSPAKARRDLSATGDTRAARSPSPTPASAPASGAASDETGAALAPVEPEYREVTIPAGTTLSATLDSPVASDSSSVEDPVRATLRSAVRAEGVVALPAGTRLSGVVTDAVRSGRVKGRARVAFRFDRLTARGESYDVATDPVAQEARSTKSSDAKKIGIGAAAGAIVGGIAGGGKGAAIGAGVGGGAGTGAVMATRGDEVRLEAGTPIQVRLDSPLTVRVPAGP